jgi:hypothetical protein
MRQEKSRQKYQYPGALLKIPNWKDLQQRQQDDLKGKTQSNNCNPRIELLQPSSNTLTCKIFIQWQSLEASLQITL